MSRLLSIHSFRRGTGKTTLAVNLAVLAARSGRNVAVVDLNFAAPSLPVLFGLEEAALRYTVNDFIWGQCEIADCAVEVTAVTGSVGRLYVVGASSRPLQIARMLRGGYHLPLLHDGCQEIAERLALDLVVVDMGAGLSEETQLITAVSDDVVIVTRPDKQDYQGTGILVELAQRLAVPNLILVVNQVPAQYEPTAVRDQFQQVYASDVTTVLPHSQTLMVLGSSGVFVLEYPADTVTAVMQQLVDRLTDY